MGKNIARLGCCIFGFALLLVLAGCSGEPAVEETSSSAPAPPPVTSTKRVGLPELPPAPDNVAPAETVATSEPEEPAQEVREVAVAGVGKKGKGYGGGVISQPVSSYFGARERIAFMSVQKAMRTFEALHERNPDSHEEFMKEIVEENGISLPSLFEGERYEYDPERGELMVVKPAN